MPGDRRRWAEALAIEQWKGEEAEQYITARIDALALAGDGAGVNRFMQIADVLELLRQTPERSN